MCSYQTLFHDDNTGYVVRCRSCDNLQLGFGNLVLTLNVEGFQTFRSGVRTILLGRTGMVQKENIRCIAIPTPCEGIKLLLCLRELRDLDRMLDGADTELQSAALLELFQ